MKNKTREKSKNTLYKIPEQGGVCCMFLGSALTAAALGSGRTGPYGVKEQRKI